MSSSRDDTREALPREDAEWCAAVYMSWLPVRGVDVSIPTAAAAEEARRGAGCPLPFSAHGSVRNTLLFCSQPTGQNKSLGPTCVKGSWIMCVSTVVFGEQLRFMQQSTLVVPQSISVPFLTHTECTQPVSKDSFIHYTQVQV